jgi:hypothetical protein
LTTVLQSKVAALAVVDTALAAAATKTQTA